MQTMLIIFARVAAVVMVLTSIQNIMADMFNKKELHN